MRNHRKTPTRNRWTALKDVFMLYCPKICPLSVCSYKEWQVRLESQENTCTLKTIMMPKQLFSSEAKTAFLTRPSLGPSLFELPTISWFFSEARHSLLNSFSSILVIVQEMRIARANNSFVKEQEHQTQKSLWGMPQASNTWWSTVYIIIIDYTLLKTVDVYAPVVHVKAENQLHVRTSVGDVTRGRKPALVTKNVLLWSLMFLIPDHDDDRLLRLLLLLVKRLTVTKQWWSCTRLRRQEEK